MSQMDLYDILVEPGLYECSKQWVNSMGHKWKPGDQVKVIKQVNHLSCLVVVPGQKQHFEIMIDTIKNNFKHL